MLRSIGPGVAAAAVLVGWFLWPFSSVAVDPVASGYATYGLAWLAYERGQERLCRQLLTEAAKDGFAPAILDLGRMFTAGIGGNRDIHAAERYYVLAANRGHGLALTLKLRLWSKGGLGVFKFFVGQILFWPSRVVSSTQMVSKRFDEEGLHYIPRR